jgi:hypothetical protein
MRDGYENYKIGTSQPTESRTLVILDNQNIPVLEMSDFIVTLINIEEGRSTQMSNCYFYLGTFSGMNQCGAFWTGANDNIRILSNTADPSGILVSHDGEKFNFLYSSIELNSGIMYNTIGGYNVVTGM